MSRNPYIDLCLHVQALRRQAEEVRTPLASALGVAGSIYTHQVANVLRVLTDVRVRHLLADEVGLGKTVQALMILNALRRQRRDLRALIIVPDRLVPQWRDELMTRAHTAPCETDDPDDGQYVWLAWDKLYQVPPTRPPKLALSQIDPTRFHVLIVDELHQLNSNVQNRVARVGGQFEHLLVLTATPSFQSPKRHAQLFALLEPERTARARWDVADGTHGLTVADDLSAWPDSAAQRVVDWLLERDHSAATAADPGSLPETALALCAYRRVIRTRRIDYPGVLPRRQHFPVVVEPLGAEVDRQALMWRYFTHLDDLSTRFDPVLLAKRVILSPSSLEQRVDFFRRRGHERDRLLEQVKPLVHKSNGDSRADALVDVLGAVWARDPKERVLVAAQDNLTVDYLFKLVQARLPEIGPIGARVPLVAAQVRQGQEEAAFEDLGGFGNEWQENLEEFQRGEAQVLFATDDTAQVGLNLQCARVLVLYSVPWRPEEVEQWIGRLDRIGNVAAFSNEGAAQTIDVYTIAQRGLVDEKVVTVLQRFHAFERGVNLGGAHLGEVTQAIEDAALRPDAVNWTALEERAASMAAEDAVQELGSPLRAHLPWNRRWATALWQRVITTPPVAPVIRMSNEGVGLGPDAWDRAVEPMLKLLDKAGDYTLHWNTDPETRLRYRTIWYRFGNLVFGHKVVPARVILGFGADPAHERSPKHAHAFVTRRGDIGTPPWREVLLELDHESVRRPLRFANFGDALHDELIEGWARAKPDSQALDVTYPDDHELWEHAKPGWFLVRLSVLDPAEALPTRRLLVETIHAVAAAATKSSVEHVPELMAPFSSAAWCALEADVRWLRASLMADSILTGRCLSRQEWQDVSEVGVTALLNPVTSGRELPRAAAVPADFAVDAEIDRIRSSDRNGRGAWASSWSEFAADLQMRLFVVAEEARDAMDLALRALERAEVAVADARERGNRAQITFATRIRDGAVDVVKMTGVFWQMRSEWLRACEVRLVELRPRELLVTAIRARPATDWWPSRQRGTT